MIATLSSEEVLNFMVRVAEPFNVWPIFYKDGRVGCQVYSLLFLSLIVRGMCI